MDFKNYEDFDKWEIEDIDTLISLLTSRDIFIKSDFLWIREYIYRLYLYFRR